MLFSLLVEEQKKRPINYDYGQLEDVLKTRVANTFNGVF